jgi:hypothetical protein
MTHVQMRLRSILRDDAHDAFMTLPVYNTNTREDQVYQLSSGPKPCRVGLLGAFLAGLIMNLLLPDTTPGSFGTIMAAFLGAVILLAIMHLSPDSRDVQERVRRYDANCNQRVSQSKRRRFQWMS